MAAELDYAYLAEFAKAENGTITAIGASFTQVSAHEFPAYQPVSVAGRVRRAEGDPDPELRVTINMPGEEAEIETTALLTSTQGAVVYDGKVANVFVMSAPFIISGPGLCEVNIYIDEVHARRLAFEILDVSE